MIVYAGLCTSPEHMCTISQHTTKQQTTPKNKLNKTKQKQNGEDI